MGKCDMDDCSLAGHIEKIVENQQKMADAYNESQKDMIKSNADVTRSHDVFVERVDGFMTSVEKSEENNKREHDLLFKRARLVVKWPHLMAGIATVGTIFGVLFKVYGG